MMGDQHRIGLKAHNRGYTMIEIVMAMLIGTILAAMAVPQVRSGVNGYRLNSAVAMAKWAIQSTRFQALEKGYPYQVVFSSANLNYQIQNLPPTCGVTPCATYQNVGATVPLSSWPMTFNQDTTINFLPNGYVSATAGSNVFTIAYQGTTATITVSNYGNVAVSCSNNVINPTC